MACLIGILQLLDEFHYKRLWEALMGPNYDRKPLKDFLLRVGLLQLVALLYYTYSVFCRCF